ncbi:MAG: ABC transporter substrate-binding protein [Nitrosomonadales bacterium]|nr:ABC transporter substrate-binding protein [Nitrosomonadales bacterium]
MPHINASGLPSVWLLLAMLAVPVANPARAVVAGDAGSEGKRIYREGMLPSGQPLRGIVRNGAVLSGAAAACAGCHRRSGLGGGEGQNAVRPIAGRLLFASAQVLPGQRPVGPYGGAVETRPVYTLHTLARALREGVDPAGRKLDALMPRFELNDDDVRQLAAYLWQLAPNTAPGVTAGEIHFATVIAPGVAPAQQQAMLGVLQAFFDGKNGGTRQEQRRREVGRNVTGSEQMYRAYRKWQLHTWRLTGPPESWAAQLEDRYREQPVFALLSGAGTGDWQPVHEFCERNEIPCLFPSIGFSGLAHSGYATFYFSRGAELEAGVLAKHLADSGATGNIVQVFRDEAAGRAPALALRAALRQHGEYAVADRPLPAGEPVSAAFWGRLLDTERPQTLILWLNDADLADFPLQRAAPPEMNSLYVSASLVAQTGRLQQADGWMDKLRIVDQSEPAPRRAQHLARMNVWLRARNIPLADERLQANAFFAASIAGDALAHMDENFSRDYFIERVEHMTEQSLFHSVYPRLSLGPGQRFASKGGYVTGFAQDGVRGTAQRGDWIVP